MTKSDGNQLAVKPVRTSVERMKKSTLILVEKIPDLTKASIQTGLELLKTKTGSRAVTGAAAGAAIAAALPFVSIASGILLGAGALVMWKTAKDEGL